ncbi:hypothetical protein BDR05DRAFT_993937 [Suillus weaverae]|nr:hypothetical protein BDR05DRAFT_993937 [Suillus weaverae]
MSKNKKMKSRGTKGDYDTFHKTEVFCKCSECVGECGPQRKQLPKWKQREYHKREDAHRAAMRNAAKRADLAAIQVVEMLPQAVNISLRTTDETPFQATILTPAVAAPSQSEIDLTTPLMQVDEPFNEPRLNDLDHNFDVDVPMDDLFTDQDFNDIQPLDGDVEFHDGSDRDLPADQGVGEAPANQCIVQLLAINMRATADDNVRDPAEANVSVPMPTCHAPTEASVSVLDNEGAGQMELADTLLNLPPLAAEVIEAASDHWFWRIILLLGVWLNLHFHLPHLACALFLKVMRHIFIGLNTLAIDDKVALTLNTAFNHLNIKDNFHIHPVCPSCHRVYPHDVSADSSCTICMVPLFKPSTERSSTSVGPSKKPSSMKTTKPKPSLQCLQNPMSNAILRLLSQKGMEEHLDAWHSQSTIPGKSQTMQDGQIWKTIKGHDGKLFFNNGPDCCDKDELHIGITLRFDGFSYQHSRNAGTHSSDLLIFFDRYRPCNLMLFEITPGPKEFNSDELQFFMKNYVDDLIRLYKHGINVKTPNFPEGRRVRVILVAVCCDHPALCKVCGFGGHYKEEGFCTHCHIKRSELQTKDAMSYDKFPPRLGNEHIRQAQEYQTLDEKDRDAFFKEHSARYFELSWIIRCHWYDSWIQMNTLRKRTEKKDRELDHIHSYLETFEMPSWVGRLPEQVGYPAGGSLTSDEWKGLALVFCPIVIPFIWDKWCPKNAATYEKALTSWETREWQCLLCVGVGRGQKKDENPSNKPKPQMDPHGSDNFLKLAAALKIILGRSIQDSDIPHAKQLLNDYLLEYLELYPDDVKPTHHWVTHIFDQLHDYGPVYHFWTFLFERLNKVLKSYSTNNHGGGEIELSALSTRSSDEGLSAEDQLLLDAVNLILATDGDTWGTVASLTHEMDQAAEDHTYPDAGVLSRSASTHAPDANFLSSHAKVFSYIILNGRRIAPSSSSTTAANSIVQAEIAGRVYVGQVISIIRHSQKQVPYEVTLLEVRWLQPKEDLEMRDWVK